MTAAVFQGVEMAEKEKTEAESGEAKVGLEARAAAWAGQAETVEGAAHQGVTGAHKVEMGARVEKAGSTR